MAELYKQSLAETSGYWPRVRRKAKTHRNWKSLPLRAVIRLPWQQISRICYPCHLCLKKRTANRSRASFPVWTWKSYWDNWAKQHCSRKGEWDTKKSIMDEKQEKDCCLKHWLFFTNDADCSYKTNSSDNAPFVFPKRERSLRKSWRYFRLTWPSRRWHLPKDEWNPMFKNTQPLEWNTLYKDLCCCSHLDGHEIWSIPVWTSEQRKRFDHLRTRVTGYYFLVIPSLHSRLEWYLKHTRCRHCFKYHRRGRGRGV